MVHATHVTKASALAYGAIGKVATENLKLVYHDVPVSLEPGQVLVEMLAAPINPQDLMVLTGKYPVKPSHAVGDDLLVPGFDGACRVVSVANEGIKALKPGDLAIPTRHGMGTWRSHAVLTEDELMAIPASADPVAASVLRLTFAPAYLMVQDMATLHPGDWIIQNAATSAIAQMTSQFARLRGIHTISVIRDRDENEGGGLAALRTRLSSLGTEQSFVLTESELRDASDLGSDKRIMMALDSVFGASGAQLARVLSPGATFVNYGSLGEDAGQGIQLTQQMLFWKQIQFKNFRLSQSLGLRSHAQVESLLHWFLSLMESELISPPRMKQIRWNIGLNEDCVEGFLKEAVRLAGDKGCGKAVKQVLVFD